MAMKAKYIKEAWLVLTLALGFGAALAGVETWLRPRIEANKLEATLREIPNLVDGADPNASRQVAVDPNQGPVIVTAGEGAGQEPHEAFRAIDRNGEQIGWVVKAGGKGFADRIEVLIGLDAQAFSITGLSILDHKETPGLGNEIEEMGTEQKRGFLWQFRHYGFEADTPLKVTKASPKSQEGNKVKAVSGATISSRSVCDIINEALSHELLKKLADAARDYNATQ